jgi:hypothetical protein
VSIGLSNPRGDKWYSQSVAPAGLGGGRVLTSLYMELVSKDFVLYLVICTSASLMTRLLKIK